MNSTFLALKILARGINEQTRGTTIIVMLNKSVCVFHVYVILHAPHMRTAIDPGVRWKHLGM